MYYKFSHIPILLQGAFALCHVVKRNEQGFKTVDYQGDSHQANKVALSPSPSASQVASCEAPNNVFGMNIEQPSPQVNLINGSYESTPNSSPSDFGREMDIEPTGLAENTVDAISYMSQFPTLDTSKVYKF